MKKILKSFVLAMLCAAIFMQVGTGLFDGTVFAQDDEGYYLYEEGNETALFEYNDASDVVNYFDTFAPIEGKKYKLVLKEDLVLPVDGTSVKSLVLKGNIVLNAGDHNISAENGATEGRLIKVTDAQAKIIGAKFNGNKACAGIEASNSNLNIKDSTFEYCYSDYAGGAISFDKSKFNIDGSTFTKCVAENGGALNISDSWGDISDSSFIGNTAKEPSGKGGAIYIESADTNNRTISLDATKLIRNTAASGGGIYAFDGDLLIKNSIISENKSKTKETVDNGGGICINLYDATLRAENSQFTKNEAVHLGGAIYALQQYNKDDFEYPKLSKMLFINTVFSGNKAGSGYYNLADYMTHKEDEDVPIDRYIQRENSLSGKLIFKKDGRWTHLDNLLNNYDISCANKEVTVTYDANGGFGNFYVDEGVDETVATSGNASGHDIKIKTLKETGISHNASFKGWNTMPNGKGTWYQEGQEIKKYYGNLYLYAIWTGVRTNLTLDENYKCGDVTVKEVYVGDTMDAYLYTPKRRGYTFRAWSYDAKKIDGVHGDDIINEPTTIYAIWDKAAKEEDEEPEEIKGMTHKAYIFGYPDGAVRPNGEITRAEAAAMLARLLEIESIGSAEAPSFPDTPSAWYNKAINAVVQRGIMKGYPDGTFKPNDAITRAEFTQMIWAIDNKPYGTAPFADVVGHWAERPIGSEYQAGRIMGYPDGTFRPDAHITRCEAAVILNKIFERNFDAMSLMKCKNPQMIKYFTDLDASFWGYNELVEATNTHEYIRRTKGRVEENWLLIK